jgi:hypothetical protein
VLNCGTLCPTAAGASGRATTGFQLLMRFITRRKKNNKSNRFRHTSSEPNFKTSGIVVHFYNTRITSCITSHDGPAVAGSRRHRCHLSRIAYSAAHLPASQLSRLPNDQPPHPANLPRCAITAHITPIRHPGRTCPSLLAQDSHRLREHSVSPYPVASPSG